MRGRLEGLSTSSWSATNRRAKECTAGIRCCRRRVADFTIAPTDPEDMALLHFTSGTTGKAEGRRPCPRRGGRAQRHRHYALDLHEDDVFWCTADPGWVTGTSYGIIAPLTNGVTNVVVEAEFDAQTWYRCWSASASPSGTRRRPPSA
jgi:acyl-coenzyme A synthetase/AMP-(fatty) acid ligase